MALLAAVLPPSIQDQDRASVSASRDRALSVPVTATPRSALAFRDVYAEHFRYVWRVVRRLGVPAADAEDVCQEVFVVVHRKLGEFAHRSSVRTWLYGIGYRCASEYRRRAHVRRELPTDTADIRAVDAEQLETVDRRRARALLDEILGELDGDKRAVFVFYEIEQLSMAEVAEVLSCPVQTAYSRLHAARRHVQAAAARLRAKERPV